VATSARREYILVTYVALSMQHCDVNTLPQGATWGISGDVCHMCILCSFAGMLTTIA
jgi:hypothetical protein